MLFETGFDIVGSDRSALRHTRDVGFSGPPSEPDVRVTTHPALHKVPCDRRVSSGCRRPGRRDPRRSIAVTSHCYFADVVKSNPVLGGPPSWQVAAFQLPPIKARVLAAQPMHYAAPSEAPHVVESGLRHPVLKVVGPPPQHRIELAQKALQRPLPTRSRDCAHRALQNRARDSFLGHV